MYSLNTALNNQWVRKILQGKLVHTLKWIKMKTQMPNLGGVAKVVIRDKVIVMHTYINK